ncbi:Serine/threonine protein kinase [Halopseudomonas sabulinigri]|uniref:non-specific serine/threonine protein kinase n=1 Tax=Halopseudomonas sabulinigri TaxID=472181 RepID=A0A1H1LNJ5_9GAMM|nr:bifunctional protein-serine/threonine kinase/phosphatase [Halopseudomonas sabulinigri]SDR75449.1 Serine/threonine protein kinase [Halopseudomonas sabulinigri]
MSKQLVVQVGQYSDKGRKAINQDFHGAWLPPEPQLSAKGVAVALADGISSSSVSQIASESAVSGFLADYYCTSEAWTVKKSAQRVLIATNSWLHAQTRQSQYRYDRDRGYVCTFSALIIKAATAYLFHIGDARIYRVAGQQLEQLTQDHRLWVSQEQSHLARALGVNQQLEIDYQALPLEQGDTFVLATDGIYEFASPAFISQTIAAQQFDLDNAARLIAAEALAQGSDDNLTVQIVRIAQLPSPDAAGNRLTNQAGAALPLPPVLEPRMLFDGYRIMREVHSSSRSHVYLAVDEQTGERVILKTPSIDLGNDPAYLERFLMEEWIARRLNSPHVLRPCATERRREYLYIATEYIEGQTLRQWMIDNPKPTLEQVRGIVEQIAKGLQAFHRLEMLHQDLRPDNIMIDSTGTVKIIDFGSTRVAGLMEMGAPQLQEQMLGTVQYSAPEYFLGEGGTSRSDQFSLATITYQMLSGKLPYGTQAAKARTRAAQNKLVYQSVLHEERDIPAWIDDVLKRALQPNPLKRYEALSEFVFDLRQPSAAFLSRTRPPLLERNPLLFWKSLSFVLVMIIAALLAW